MAFALVPADARAETAVGPRTMPTIAPSVAPAPRPTVTPANCVADDKVRVDRFWMSPGSSGTANPPAGRVVQIWVTVANACAVTLPTVPWRVTRIVPFPAPGVPGVNETLLQGRFDNLGPGEIRSIQCGTWTAVGGSQNFVFYVDPDNSLHETARWNNSGSVADYVVSVAPNWAAWGPAARVAAQQGTNRWLGEIEVQGEVNGSTLTFLSGRTLRPKSRPFDTQPMISAGAPGEVIGAFYSVTSDAWASWVSGYQGPPSPGAFPSFSAYPGSQAGGMPAIPPSMPLSSGLSSNEASMSAENIGAALRTKLGAATLAQPGAAAAVTDYAVFVHDHFVAWRRSATLSNLIGSGPVPTFAPPAVPVGPVVGGKASGKVGGGF